MLIPCHLAQRYLSFL